MSGVAGFITAQQLRGAWNVGIGKDEHGGVAAQFHGDPFHVRARLGGELFAYRHGAGEGDFAHGRRGDQRFGNMRGFAPDDVQTACGQPGIVEGARHCQHAAGAVFRPFEDDGATGGQRGADFADGLVVGEIPRREGAAHADGFAQDELLDFGRARRDDAPVNAAGFFGVPVAVIGAAEYFDARLGQRFALVEGNLAGDAVDALTRQFSGAAQDGAAFQRRGVFPASQRARGGGNGAGEIVIAGQRQFAQRFQRGGVDDRLGAAVFGAEKFAVNIETECVVIGAGGVHAAFPRRNRRRRRAVPGHSISNASAVASAGQSRR